LLVSIMKSGRLTFRQFGVIVKGSIDEVKSPKSASRLLNAMMSGAARIDAPSTPICVFLFAMTGNRGFYAWRYEPSTSGGLPKLRGHGPYECKELDEQALGEIVRRVDDYYDAVSKSLAS